MGEDKVALVEWSYHDLRIATLAKYIREKLEKRCPELGWQEFLDESRKDRTVRHTRVAAAGIFIGGGILATVILRQRPGPRVEERPSIQSAIM